MTVRSSQIYINRSLTWKSQIYVKRTKNDKQINKDENNIQNETNDMQMVMCTMRNVQCTTYTDKLI